VSTWTIEKKQTTDNEIENIKPSLVQWRRRFGGGRARNVEARVIKRRAALASRRRRAGWRVGSGTLVEGTIVFGGGEGRYPLFLHRWQAALSQLAPEKKRRNSCTLPPPMTTIPYRKGARVSVSHVCLTLYWRGHGIPVPARSTQVPEDTRSIKKFCNNPSISYYYLLPSFVILNALSFFV